MAKKKDLKDPDVRIVMTNRKARHLYHIDHTWEAGMVLHGTEVKALRQGGGSIVDSYAEVVEGQVWLVNLHIPPYAQGNIHNVESKRRRKLLLNKREIKKITGGVAEKGHTLIPLRVYFRKAYVKIEIALARGKRDYDKREDLKTREQKRDMDREMAARR